ncbi:uncharacterized protein SPSK_10975 [Sporothrix schenckii 1099-18]|uniref:Uncharacterized protein n=2 Tax=Sporothrix schenckii TaxID=29908 RepID=U7Q3Z4_SPOS1|nr:uncharacterized protein SPSK_10975 [Sporothrix schenckii 1099-18]ERT02619.1 hypothetical protein HMPREF1624_00920 [Sporothrix schenckii ATCC 58251]KJR80084.1 hypothetical protein SPSK_10975 [Sporothrix schenckii 1099-18]
MSLWSSYRGLSPKTRAGVGVGILLWGTIGLYFSDAAGERIGIKPTETDKDNLARMTPRIHVVDRDDTKR